VVSFFVFFLFSEWVFTGEVFLWFFFFFGDAVPHADEEAKHHDDDTQP
jgi:hypothetical protein